MSRLLSFAAIAAAVVSFFPSAASAQVPANTSWVRVVHASVDAPAVDVLANGNVVFQGLRFRDFTEYTSVPPGTYTFRVNLTGTQTTAVQSGAVNLQGGVAYTFYAVGRVANNSLLIMGTGDDVIAPAPGSTKIRVVHAASTAPPVDVYATTPYAPLPASPTLASVPFPFGGPYLTVPAGVYQARATPAGGRAIAIDSGRLPLLSGTVRTVVALDPASPNGLFQLLVLPDIN